MSDKPTVFIASSLEAISVAEAVHIKLEQEVRATLWENSFDLSSITIITLINKIKEVDYGVFVFHPDDKTLIREKEYSSVRDNVLLELGMFIGALGLERCFILVPRSIETIFRLATDLAGLTVSFYDDQESDMTDAVTGSCAKIKRSIKKLESQKINTETASEVEALKEHVSSMQSQLWRFTHELQIANESYQYLLGAIKSHFFSVAKAATPAEIKAWEDGAKDSYLKEIKISAFKVFYIDQEVIIPPLHGASSCCVIVKEGVRVHGTSNAGHNEIYFMDGFRRSASV